MRDKTEVVLKVVITVDNEAWNNNYGVTDAVLDDIRAYFDNEGQVQEALQSGLGACREGLADVSVELVSIGGKF